LLVSTFNKIRNQLAKQKEENTAAGPNPLKTPLMFSVFSAGPSLIMSILSSSPESNPYEIFIYSKRKFPEKNRTTLDKEQIVRRHYK
jgi:hypothetical protein